MTTPTSSPLPPMQAAWIEELVGGPVPAETRATCSDCAMCNHVAPGAGSFNPETKCCTYLPSLANFLVGQVLVEDDPASATGRASVEARVAAGIGVTPLGLGRAAVSGLLYRFGSAHGFGHSRALRCPHYIEEGGLCGIWRHRNSVCATWFCKHVRGLAGWAFWERVQQLLSAIEQALSRWCILELGIGAAALQKLFPPTPRSTEPDNVSLALADLEGRPDPVEARALWGTWAGREAEFYAKCAGLVEGIDLAEVLRRCGAEAQVRAELVRATWAQLVAPEPPQKLRTGRLTVVGTGPGSCRVSTYSGLDPLEMPRALFDVLHQFDGRPTEEVRAAIADAGGPHLTPALVRKMADFGVLEPVEAADRK